MDVGYSLQVIKGYFGGIGHGVEHRFAKKDLPDGDTVQSAYQLAVKVTLEGMGDAQFV